MQSLLLLVLVGTLSAEIIISTTIHGKNITIYKDDKVHASFDPKNVHETTCHPSPLFIEQVVDEERDFYVQNTALEATQVSVNLWTMDLPANHTEIYQYKYPACFVNWNHVKINFGKVEIEYIKMCQPLKTPYYPVIILLMAAIILVFMGSVYGQNHAFLFGEEQHGDIDAASAIYFVVIASTGLMVLYLFGEYIQIFLQLWVMFVGFTALQNGITDVATMLFGCADGNQVNLPYFGAVTDKKIISSAVALAIVLTYFFTKQWMVSNIIAVALTMLMFKLIEVDSLRTATILLTLAFFYDIFWVFYSHIFFGESVMSQVATQIDLPMKLQCPELFNITYPIARCSLIGLGDIILPGIVLKYAYRCDQLLGKRRLFPVAYLGYVCGLLACMYCLIVYQLAQPALLYLVPCIMIPVLCTARLTSNFKTIWRGDLDKLKNEPHRVQQIDQDYELAAGEI